MEQILAVLTPEQRAVLQPHLDKMHAAEVAQQEARHTIATAVLAFFPALSEPGVAFDSHRCVLIRREEVDRGPV